MLDWYRHPAIVHFGFMIFTVVSFFGGHALGLWVDPTGLALVPMYGAALFIVAAVALYLV